MQFIKLRKKVQLYSISVHDCLFGSKHHTESFALNYDIYRWISTQTVGKNSDCHVIELKRNACIFFSLEIAIHKEYLPSEFLKSGMET